jgi:hypothetical protein
MLVPQSGYLKPSSSYTGLQVYVDCSRVRLGLCSSILNLKYFHNLDSVLDIVQ